MFIFYELKKSQEIYNNNIKEHLGFKTIEDYKNSLLWVYSHILNNKEYTNETKSDLLCLVASWIRGNTHDKTKADLLKEINEL